MLVVSFCFAGDDPLTAERRAKLKSSLEEVQADATRVLNKEADDLNSYSRRGDARFFLGDFAGAVADYDEIVRIDASQADSHWRRGIALFYAGKYADAAAQFERYHSFDQVDRENGIWRYLCQHRSTGKTKAREGLLKYEKDDREPFPAVYKLFAGTVTADEILEGIRTAKVSDTEREKRLFYAHLYIGLNAAVEGDESAAQKHLFEATRNRWAPVAGYGPNYMWHVGRLHEAQLRAKLDQPK